MSVFDDVHNRLTAQTNNAIGVIKGFSVLGAGTALAKNVVGTLAPQASGALSKALRGDYLGAGVDALRQTAIGKTVNGLLTGKLGSELLFNGLPNPLLGGITPFEAAQIIQDVQSTNYAKKNLYFLEIVDFDPRTGGAGADISGRFNLFSTAITVGPNTISGEGHQIGSAVMDSIHGTERVEIRLTSYDNAAGDIKAWFNTRANLLAKSDGTFGVPADYLVQIRILHAAISDDVMARFGGYEERFIARPTSLETDLSRTEDGLQEIQMSFSQFDTFMF